MNIPIKLTTEEISQKIIAAADAFHGASVGVLTGLAPLFGMVPAVAITYIHTEQLVGGWAWAVVIGLDAISIGLAAVRVSLRRYGLERHDTMMRNSFWTFVLFVAAGNIAMSIKHHGLDIAPIIAETALSLSPIFVSSLVSISAEIAGVIRDRAAEKAQERQDKADEVNNTLLIEAQKQQHELNMLREKAKIRAEKFQKVAESSEKVPEPVETFPKDFRKLTNIQKVKLAAMPDGEISHVVGVDPKTEKNWRKRFADEGVK